VCVCEPKAPALLLPHHPNAHCCCWLVVAPQLFTPPPFVSSYFFTSQKGPWGESQSNNFITLPNCFCN
jgi:hypothetical protein